MPIEESKLSIIEFLEPLFDNFLALNFFFFFDVEPLECECNGVPNYRLLLPISLGKGWLSMILGRLDLFSISGNFLYESFILEDAELILAVASSLFLSLLS